MIPIYPDLEWYGSVSDRRQLTVRCPYASEQRCPKYFESVSILAEENRLTILSQPIHEQLGKKWSVHPLWPLTEETATTHFGDRSKGGLYSNLCPEVAFIVFKVFASKVIEFYDGAERDQRHDQLEDSGERTDKDWRWQFDRLEAMHFSECSLYSKIAIDNPFASDRVSNAS